MRYITISIIVILNFILQSTILHRFSLMGVAPNTSLVLVVSFALLGGKKTGSILGILIGLLQDIIFCDVIGVHALIYFIVGYSIGLIEQKLFKENIFIPFLFTAVSTIGFHLIYYFFMYFLGLNVSIVYLFKNIMLWELIYNSVISIFAYKQATKLYRNPNVSFIGSRRR